MWKKRIPYFASLSIQKLFKELLVCFFLTELFFYSKHEQVSISRTHVCLPNKIYLFKVK